VRRPLRISRRIRRVQELRSLPQRAKPSELLLPQLDGGCLLAFSTPLRAADYASVAASKQTFTHFCSSPKQVVFGVNELREGSDVRHRVQQAATVNTSEQSVKSMKSLEEGARVIATTQAATSAIRDDMTRSPTCAFSAPPIELCARQANRNFLSQMPLV